jgi:hypothetical protein
MSAYAQPSHYERHDPDTCPACQRRADVGIESGQEGVSGLLNGSKLSIVPEGFEATHQRLTRIDWQAVKSELAPAHTATNGAAHE